MLRLQLRQVLLRRLHHAAHGHPAFELLLVPLQDRRRRKADDAHLQRHRQLAAVRGVGLDGLAHHRPRLEQRLAVARAGHVGQHQREVRPGAALGGAAVDVHRRAGDLRQERQAVVELVIAGGGAVVADAVHGAIDRQLLLAAHRLGQRLVVGQHRALDGVAIVEQEGVGKLPARLADQRHGALVAQRRVGFELVVVVAEDVGVQVGGFQDRHVGPRAVGQRGVARQQATAACQQARSEHAQGELGRSKPARNRPENVAWARCRHGDFRRA